MADLYEQAGAAILEGKTPKQAPPDPYEAAGATILDRVPVTVPAAQAPPVAQPWEYTPPEAGGDMMPRPSEFPTTVAEARNALAPQPGYVRLGGLASVLPFAWRETKPGSGQIDTSKPSWSDIRWDPGATVSALGGNALLDLLEGTGQATSVGGPNAPLAGKVSPEATAFMLGTRMAMRPRNALEFGPPEARPPSAGDLRAAPLPPEFTANPLTPEAKATVTAATPIPAAPATQTGIPVVRESPAPLPNIPTGLTPEQEAEYSKIPETLPRMKGEIKTPEDAAARADDIIRHFASAGNKEPIPGAVGGLHTITQNAGLSTLYRAVRDLDPTAFVAAGKGLKTDAMNTLRAIAGTGDDLTAAKTERATTVRPMYQKAWANKTEADPSRPIQTIQEIMKSPAKQNDTVMAELPKILKKLQDETDPEQLKGITDSIDATLERLKTEGKADRETRRVLAEVDKSITSAISPAAPGFDAAQAKWSQMSRRIDEMTYLQGRKLTDLQGQPTLGNLRSMLDDIAKKQAGDKLHPADSVTEENLRTLQQVHDQLQREAYAQGAGKSIGSNTFQNLATNTRMGSIAGHAGNALLTTGTGMIADLAAGGSGMIGALSGAGTSGLLKGIEASQAAKAAARQDAGRQMLMRELRDRLLNIDNKGLEALRRAP